MGLKVNCRVDLHDCRFHTHTYIRTYAYVTYSGWTSVIHDNSPEQIDCTHVLLIKGINVDDTGINVSLLKNITWQIIILQYTFRCVWKWGWSDWAWAWLASQRRWKYSKQMGVCLFISFQGNTFTHCGHVTDWKCLYEIVCYFAKTTSSLHNFFIILKTNVL